MRRKERKEVEILIQKQKEQYHDAQASLAKYQQAIDDMRKKVFEQRKKRDDLVAQNDSLIEEINRTNKTIQQFQVRNQELVKELEELKEQLIK